MPQDLKATSRMSPTRHWDPGCRPCAKHLGVLCRCTRARLVDAGIRRDLQLD